MRTKVIFRMFKGEALAMFPELLGDYSPSTCLSYAHMGQHGTAQACPLGRPAAPAEYADLMRELQGLGYDLRIISRMTRAHYQARADEISQIARPLNTCPYCLRDVELIGTVIPDHLATTDTCPGAQKQFADAIHRAGAIRADILKKGG